MATKKPAPKKATTKKATTKKAATKKATTNKAATKKAATKTQPTAAGVATLLATLDPETRADCERIDGWMRAATRADGVMYGKAIAGYGTTTIRYADGREAPWMKMGFSPRKQSLVLYGLLGPSSPALLQRLGKHDTGKGCLYVKRLSDVDTDVLRALIESCAEE